MILSNWAALNELNALIRLLEAQTHHLTEALDAIKLEKDRALRLRDEMTPLASWLDAAAIAASAEKMNAAATHPMPETVN